MPTVLVIEDNESSRFVIRSVLEHAGYQVMEARTAEDAVAMCADHPGGIALIVTDAILGTDVGADVARQIRQQCPTMPVLFVSGFSEQQLATRGFLNLQEFREAAAGFLQKPFAARTLVNRVESLLADHQNPTH